MKIYSDFSCIQCGVDCEETPPMTEGEASKEMRLTEQLIELVSKQNPLFIFLFTQAFLKISKPSAHRQKVPVLIKFDRPSKKIHLVT
jgi:hypothetical protein